MSYESAHAYLQLLTNYLLDQWQPYDDSDSKAEEQEERNQHEMDKARDEWLVEDILALAVCIELRMTSSEEEEDVPRMFFLTEVCFKY